LAEIAPLLNERAASLRRELEDVQMLRALQTEAADRLEAGLQDVQAARTALNQAMAERTELPLQFTNDPVRMAILLASTDTLDGFARALDEMVLDPSVLPRLTLNEQKGALPLPVQGVVLRAAGEVDAAGVSRPGLLIATRPRAIVTSPAAATIRYTGPLLDLGEVVILEPQGGTLFVLAGLDVVYAQAGEVIEAGAPLGLMGSKEAINGSDLSTDGDDTGTGLTETLYMEVRQNDIPEDPEDWFRTDKDG
jgi:septal ring factor EnvC (AmiA/AmiB activator)